MPDPVLQNGPSARQVAFPRPHEAIGPEDADRIAKSISRALRRAANRSRAPSSMITGGGYAVRRGERAFQKGLWASFAACVVAPVLAASVYWGLIASKQYLTETKFALHGSESSFAALGVGGGDEKQLQDSQVVTKYILGRSMVYTLDKTIDLRRIFSRPGVDYFSRFDPDDPIETLEKYWKKRVDASVDLMSGIISVQVRAFSPEDSLLLSQKIIDLSEKLVNEMSTRSRRDALEQAQSELTRAEEHLKVATANMRDARNAEGVLDAPAAAEAINKIITRLRLDLAAAQESLALQSSAAATQSPQVKLLNARVESLKKQIAEYTAEIASAENNASLAGRAGILSERQVELSLAQQQYALASSAYESARIDLERQRAYLVPFLRPTLAEKSVYPRRWLEWSIIVAPAVFAWALLAGAAFLVRDHMAK
jgi:capsular polysaccharide transport system permease protein